MSQRSDKPDEAKINEYIERIHYSDRYSDDQYEYRHVILPKPLFKLIPKSYFNNEENGNGTLRLLSDHEWRGIGIQQSLGWVHYEIHAPEPHVLLFRRAKDYDQQIQQQIQVQPNGKSVAGRNGRKK